MNFDRVADIYDATRGLPSDVSAMVADCIVEATHAGPDTRFLELGIGTGRIALPLVERGFSYTGVDISTEMMQRLKEKAPAEAGNLTLVNGDIADLPFADGAFDVVLAVHIFHLVSDWRKAMEEARCVLAPSGAFVQGGNHHVAPSPGLDIRVRWRELVEAAGSQVRPRHGEPGDVETWLIENGAMLAEYRAATWETALVPNQLASALTARTFSQSWDVPDDVLARVDAELRQWIAATYGDGDVPLPDKQEFIVQVARWPE